MAWNEELWDAQLRHAIGVRRLSSGQARRVLALLEKSDDELAEKLATRAAGDVLRNGNFTTKRFKLLSRDIALMRKEVFAEILAAHREELLKLSGAEQEFAKQLLEFYVPVRLEYAVASAATLRALVTTQPFSGGANAARTLAQWWERTAAVDQRRILDAVQLGMVQQEAIPSIVRRVVEGTDLTRVNAEAVVRTAVNHVSNASREAFFDENAELIETLRWTSTLDGRTTAICRARDGHFAPVGEHPAPEPRLEPPTARPPAHPG